MKINFSLVDIKYSFVHETFFFGERIKTVFSTLHWALILLKVDRSVKLRVHKMLLRYKGQDN